MKYIRYILTGFLAFLVYTETGIFTGAFCLITGISIELICVALKIHFERTI